MAYETKAQRLGKMYEASLMPVNTDNLLKRLVSLRRNKLFDNSDVIA